jgi:hypothetical protein
MEETRTYTAFVGETLIASGPLDTMLPEVKARFDRDASALFLIFEDQSGRQVDFDLRGAVDEVVARALPAPPRAGPSEAGRGLTRGAQAELAKQLQTRIGEF